MWRASGGAGLAVLRFDGKQVVAEAAHAVLDFGEVHRDRAVGVYRFGAPRICRISISQAAVLFARRQCTLAISKPIRGATSSL